MSPINYEAHVTIEPVFDEAFELFESIANKYQFKPAHLLMMKQRTETAERSNRDSFCTGHAMDYGSLQQRTEALARELETAGFAVWRYKIEATLLDVRKDRLFRISPLVAA